MGFTDKKFEIAIAGFAVLMIGGMGYLLKAPVQSVVSELEVVYEMPRPKSFLAALFELGDREISRDYKNPFAGKKKEVAAKPADPKATDAAKKAGAQAKKAVAKKTDSKDKKPEVDVQIVGEKPTGPSFSDELLTASGPSGGGAQNVVAETTAGAAGDTKTVLDADQLRATLLAEPTAANVAKLVAAYQAQEISADSFYQIVGELLSSNKEGSQEMGLMAAKAVYSTQSFAVVAQHQAGLNTEKLKASAEAILNSYTTTARLPFLKSALGSSDDLVVLKATNVVLAGYQAAQTNGTNLSSDPRNSRGDVVTNSLGGYSQFVSIFQQLVKNSDNDAIRALATTALSTIGTSGQTTVVAAF